MMNKEFGDSVDYVCYKVVEMMSGFFVFLL